MHGKPGVGKSARIKEIDPEAVIVELNPHSAEDVYGISVYDADIDNLLDVKPKWLERLEKVCEEEPEKEHMRRTGKDFDLPAERKPKRRPEPLPRQFRVCRITDR